MTSAFTLYVAKYAGLDSEVGFANGYGMPEFCDQCGAQHTSKKQAIKCVKLILKKEITSHRESIDDLKRAIRNWNDQLRKLKS